MLHYVIAIEVMPSSYKLFKALQHKLKKEQLVSSFQIGTINKIKDYVVYIGNRKNNFLTDVFIIDIRESNIHKIFTSKTGDLDAKVEKIIFNLHQGLYQYINPEGRVDVLDFDSYSLVLWNDYLQGIENVMSFSEMWNLNNQSNVNFNAVKSNMHQIIVWPIYSIIFTILCLKIEWLYFYRNYRRNNSAKSLLITVLCVVILAVINFFTKNFGMRYTYINPIVYYCLPILLLQLMCSMLRSALTNKKH